MSWHNKTKRDCQKLVGRERFILCRTVGASGSRQWRERVVIRSIPIDKSLGFDFDCHFTSDQSCCRCKVVELGLKNHTLEHSCSAKEGE